ncbi:MAG TPA: undecaprenyl-diphosphate phosphatase [Thermoguttaceae bacterium]|nr:undecaprenyl-diphosphate phosphatase [Thermoguttaceae bacterium]
MSIDILILAILQGVAEFLPISSSGHIVVGQELLGVEKERLTVNVVLHFGTLLAILAFYRKRIWRLLTEDRRVIGLIVVGTIPATAAYFILKQQFESALENPLVAGFMFPLTGVMLLWAARRDSGELTCKELGYGGAALIGVFQAFAILPGISRSGSTIVAGLGSGLRRDEAAAFSFLLAIPAIGGGAVIKLAKLFSDGYGGSDNNITDLALGATVSCAVGLISLWWLVRWLQQGRLYLFAFWVIPLGVAVIAWQLL